MSTEAISKVMSHSETTKRAADAMTGEVSLTLSDAQREELTKFIAKSGRFPSSIEINFKAGLDRSALIPVTVLVGAMT